MATQKKRNRPTRPAAPRADLSQTSPEEVANILASSSGLDVEPLLLAIRVGLLDDHLDRIVTTVHSRVGALEAAAQIIAQDGDKWIIRLEHPIGRFKDADLRLSAAQLATVTNT